MKKYIEMLFEEKVNKRINITIGIIYMFLIFGVFALIPEFAGIGRYSIKTTYYLLVTIITGAIFVIFNIKRIINHKCGLIDIVLILYALFILLSTWFSDYRKEILLEYPPCRGEGTITLLAYILTFYIAYKTFKENRTLGKILTVVIYIVCSFGILQAVTGRYYGFGFNIISNIEDAKYMACSTMLNPNFFSSYINIFLPIYLVYYFLDNKLKNIGIISVMFGALICTKTLGGYITFGLVFLIISTYSMIVCKNKKQILLKILLLLCIFSIIFGILNIINDNKYYEEFIQVQEETSNLVNSDEDFGNNRMYIWKLAINMIKDNPFLGVGPDSFGREILNTIYGEKNYLFGDLLVDKAHSEYLQIAVTTGVPSLIIYLLFIFTICISLIIKYVKYAKSKELFKPECIYLIAISASIFAYLFQASANISVTCVAPMFWVMLGVGYSNIKFKNN